MYGEVFARLAGSPAWTPPPVSPFADVTPDNQFYSAITWLASTNITVGTQIGGRWYYQPNNAVNRGSMAAFMNRLDKTQLECTPFPQAIGC